MHGIGRLKVLVLPREPHVPIPEDRFPVPHRRGFVRCSTSGRPAGEVVDRNDRSCFSTDMSKGDITRRAIIERALDRAGEVGLEGVTLGVLAEDLQLSKSGLFAHFKSKERSEEHTSELQSLRHLVCRLLLEK